MNTLKYWLWKKNSKNKSLNFFNIKNASLCKSLRDNLNRKYCIETVFTKQYLYDMKTSVIWEKKHVLCYASRLSMQSWISACAAVQYHLALHIHFTSFLGSSTNTGFSKNIKVISLPVILALQTRAILEADRHIAMMLWYDNDSLSRFSKKIDRIVVNGKNYKILLNRLNIHK